MPIGIVTDDDFLRELESYKDNKSPEPTRTPVVEVLDKPGRKEGDTNIPDSLRKIIGETSVLEGRKAALGLAGMFGISPSSVSAYAKGATSTTSYNEPKKSIIEHITKSRKRAIKKAQHVLNSAMGAITQEKLDYADAKDLSTIAKDMSVVIKNLEPPAPPSSAESNNNQQFVIFAPQFRDERSFEHITVQE